MELLNKTNLDAVVNLCVELDMPWQVVDKIKPMFAGQQAGPAGELAAALTDAAAAPEAYKQLRLMAGAAAEADPVSSAPDWPLELAVYLAAALGCWQRVYQPRGIPREVFVASMGCFPRFIGEYYATNGEYGFDRGFWTWRFTCGNIYRLGTLEYEMTAFAAHGRPLPAGLPLAGGAPILSVHIPSNAALKDGPLAESYRGAQAFFARHWPQYAYTAVFTDTWLLSPALQGVLKPGSGILRFARDYRLLWKNEESDEAVPWIFGRQLDVADMPEDSSLQRGVKALMARGGHVGSAAGVLELDGAPVRGDGVATAEAAMPPQPAKRY